MTGTPGRSDGTSRGPGRASAADSPAARVELDDSQVAALYANICRVSSTPEEVILDLALDPNPLQEGPHTVRVAQRVILNHYTAKRLLALLAVVVERHEQAFGTLETDVRKRLRPASA